MADIAVEAFTIERTTIKTTDMEYANARLAEELDAAYVGLRSAGKEGGQS